MQRKSLACAAFSDSVRVLRIRPKALRIFKKYEQKGIRSPEAGGILLGHVYRNHDEVTKATVPNRLDSRGSCFFNRSRNGAQVRVNRSWRKSHGSLIYLGEWHTHASISPQPSLIDRNMMRETLNETRMEIDLIYLVVVGLNQTYWVGRQTDKGLVQLSSDLKSA